MSAESKLQHFRQIIEQLRDKEKGCPWDLAQTHTSLKKYLLEEAYEFLEAVDLNDFQAMEEELGDLLLQIYLHARLLEESTSGKIDLESIAARIESKIIERHPHVFQAGYDSGGLSVEENWQKLKKRSEEDPFIKYRGLGGVFGLEKVLGSLKKKGFRFEHPDQALDKVLEEVSEFRAAEDEEKRKTEMADLLLSSISAAVEFGYSAEELLQIASNKLQKRWTIYSKALDNRDLNSMSYAEKEAIWNQIKHEI